MAVPEDALVSGSIFSIHKELDPVIATVAEPCSSCLNAQEKGDVKLGDTVVIIGSGPIGCIHASIARARGAEKIIIADISDSRLKMCEAFEPDIMVNASKTNLVEEVKRITNNKGAEVVITANPAGETQIQAVKMARKGGCILLFGGLPHTSGRPCIDTNLIHYGGLYLIGTTTFAPRHHLQTLSILASGKIRGDRLITHLSSLIDFENSVNLAMERKTLKIIFMS